jgi:hypothetical protein
MNKAYKALHDAEYVLGQLEQCENDKRHFRILFVACMTLLKTVGQVLICKNADPMVKEAALELFNEHKADKDKHEIYFNFIERERGLIIHKYSVNLHEHDFPFVLTCGDEACSLDLGDLCHPLGEDDYFGNEDVRDLIQKAIDWWKVQLNIIETNIYRGK